MTPENICNQVECTGCSACMNICPHDALIMSSNNEGFIHPLISNDRCVDCGLCQQVCPVRLEPILNNPLKVFSGWSKDEYKRLNSSSGGAFVEIARLTLENGGVVFGCGLNKDLQAVHLYVENINDLLSNLSGSKYVQSRIEYTYKQARSFLRSGRPVLFSGTPCQIAGLRKYLRKEYENLITVDIICHGVPSPLIFEEYKKYIEQTRNMRIFNVKFRSKKYSWIFFNMAIEGHSSKKNKKVFYHGNYYEDPYIRGFLRDNFLRPSCFHCKFTKVDRVSDFTIADWWGYKRTTSKDRGFRYKGVSLILVNTAKSLDLIKNLNMELKERTIEQAKQTNVCLSHPFNEPVSRNQFWSDYHSLTFNEVVKKYMYPERVKFDINLLQHYKNTDALLSFLRILMLPKRVFRKSLKILHLVKTNQS